MATFFTPGQFARRAEFYHQLAQLTTVGLGVVNALQRLHSSPPDHSYRKPIQAILERLGQGETLGGALRQVAWLPLLDIALLEAGEQSGRLDGSFRLLANYYNDRARMARQVIADLLYPAFLLIFFVFIAPFPEFFMSGDWKTYAIHVGIILVPLSLLAGMGIYACQSARSEAWRSFLEGALGWVPVLGRARRHLALARLAGSLEALLSAGVTVIEAWQMAAAASGSPALRRVVCSWKPALEAGSTPAELVTTSGRFPELFASQYSSGEISGRLDETLQRLRDYFEEDGRGKMHMVSQWVPRLIYLGICVAIGIHIVNFYAGYFKGIGNAIEGF